MGLVFEDISVYDILQFIEDTYGRTIVVDQRVVLWDEEPARAVSLLPADSPAFAAEPVTHGMLHVVSMRDCSVAGILDALLPQLGLAYDVAPQGAVVVSSPDLINGGNVPEQWLAGPDDVLQRVKKLHREPLDSSEAATADAEESAVPRLVQLQQEVDGQWRARIDFGGTTHSWLKPGDIREHHAVVSVNKDGVVLRNFRDGTALRLEADSSQVSPPGADSLKPRLVRLREVRPGQWRAQIDFGRSVRWVDPGDAVEAYEVLSVEENRVLLKKTETGEVWEFNP